MQLFLCSWGQIAPTAEKNCSYTCCRGLQMGHLADKRLPLLDPNCVYLKVSSHHLNAFWTDLKRVNIEMHFDFSKQSNPIFHFHEHLKKFELIFNYWCPIILLINRVNHLQNDWIITAKILPPLRQVNVLQMNFQAQLPNFLNYWIISPTLIITLQNNSL